MHVTRIGTEEFRIRLSVNLSASEANKYLGEAYISLAMHNGLHPIAGKTSREIAAEAIGEAAVSSYASETVMRRAAPVAIDLAGIEIVGVPNTHCNTPLKDGEPFSFFVDAVCNPIIPLTSYDPVKVNALNMGVDDETVDAYVEQYAASHGESVADPEKHVVESTSRILLAMRTDTSEGACAYLTFDGREYLIGNDDMPDGFDENIVGMRVGDTKEFDFIGPRASVEGMDFSQPTTYHAKVEVKAILKEIAPDVTDSWVKESIRGCETVDDLRCRIREELNRRNDEGFEQYQMYLAASELSQRLAKDIPDDVFKAFYDQMLSEFRGSIESRGISEEAYLSSRGLTAQQFKAELMSQTREQLRQGVALDSMARHLKMKLTDADMEKYLHEVAAGREDEEKKRLGEWGGMQMARQAALRAKANRYLVENAVS